MAHKQLKYFSSFNRKKKRGFESMETKTAALFDSLELITIFPSCLMSDEPDCFPLINIFIIQIITIFSAWFRSFSPSTA